MKRTIFAIALMLSVAIVAEGRKCVVSGYVTDNASFETLIAATVFDSVSATGTTTNTFGFYSLSLPEGEVVLRFSFVGYDTREFRFTLTSDTTINVPLRGMTLKEVVVVGDDLSRQAIESTQMSATIVPIEIVKKMPAIGGELDIIKVVQQMPGVQSGSEGSTGLYVRGGGPDENLIFLDGVPLYNINHAMGVFSVFNADAIKNFTLYKGNFPARFGGRLSSVLDIRQNDGNAQTYHGTVAVGLLAAHISVEGPIVNGKTSFCVSARRTYFDVLARPIIALIYAMDDMKLTAGYAFWDVNAKVTHRFSDRDRLSASFFMGDDGVDMSMSDKDRYYDDSQKLSWQWGNIVASANWTHVFTPKLFSELSLSYSQYRYKLGMKIEENEYDPEEPYSYNYNMSYNSRVSDALFKYKFDYSPHPKHEIRFGAEYTFHYYRPTVGSIFTIENQIKDISLDTVFGPKYYNHEASLYFEDDWSIHRRFKLNLGLRGTLYFADGGTVYPSLEPRVGLRVLITDDLSFKASYAYMSQNIHLLSSSNISMPTDLWVPSTAKVPSMLSHQVAAGFFYNLKGIMDISVEGYYKQMKNVIEYKDGATFVSLSGDWEDKVCVGDGWSYGVEVLLQRSIGKFTGWIGYTWSRTFRRFDRPGQEINNGLVFPAKYDREHDLSVCLQYSPIKLLDLAVTFIYGTGTCGSLPLQYTPDGIPLLTERNNFRMPDYHRMDFAINFHFDRKPSKRDGHKRFGEHQLNINIYNLYNQKNPYMVTTVGTKLEKISILPIMPSVGYTFKF